MIFAGRTSVLALFWSPSHRIEQLVDSYKIGAEIQMTFFPFCERTSWLASSSFAIIANAPRQNDSDWTCV